MKRSDWIRTLSWLVPVACFLLAGALVFVQFNRLQESRKELTGTEAEIQTLKGQIANFRSAGGKDRIPSVQDTRLEESMFLDSVRQRALAHGVHLDKWSNEAPPAPAAAAPGAAAPPDAMKSVRTLASSVEVRGEYEAVRAFLRDLLGSARLLSVKSGTWTRGARSTETTFSFRLHRYVSNEAAATPPPPTAMAGHSNVRSS